MPLVNQTAIANLSIADQTLFEVFGFGQQANLPFNTIQEAFEYNVKLYPNNIAAEHESRSITYQDLNNKANMLAQVLRDEYQIGRGDGVGLFAKRSIEFLVGIMAIVKAGGYYIPQDIGVSPVTQLTEVISQTQCKVTLTIAKFQSKVQEAVQESQRQAAILCLDQILQTTTIKAVANPVNKNTPSDIAYVIFTSGTTGKPKGVQVTHKNLVNVLLTFTNELGMRPGSRVSQLLSVMFDMGSWEMLGSMVNGSTLVIRTSTDWKAAVQTVNTVIATPSILQKFDLSDIPNVTHIAVAGEPCPLETAQKWSTVSEFYNCCGPTEITIVNTGSPYRFGQPLSIGRPTPNNNVYILSTDSTREPLQIGDVGEMWAGGLGTTAGYLHRPDLTSERYVLDPFTNDGSYMFKTGDLGRWLPNGEIETCGRVDDQVKIKGFRVELDGVSSAMEKTPGVTRAVALKIGTELIGFVAPRIPDTENVKETVSGLLAYYMVPSRVISLDQLPNTDRGKIDKRLLKSSFESDAFDIQVVAPKTLPMINTRLNVTLPIVNIDQEVPHSPTTMVF